MKSPDSTSPIARAAVLVRPTNHAVLSQFASARAAWLSTRRSPEKSSGFLSGQLGERSCEWLPDLPALPTERGAGQIQIESFVQRARSSELRKEVIRRCSSCCERLKDTGKQRYKDCQHKRYEDVHRDRDQ